MLSSSSFLVINLKLNTLNKMQNTAMGEKKVLCSGLEKGTTYLNKFVLRIETIEKSRLVRNSTEPTLRRRMKLHSSLMTPFLSNLCEDARGCLSFY